MEVVLTCVRRLLYRFGAPTIVLAIVSGLVGGLALVARTVSRRTTGVRTGSSSMQKSRS